jgi:molecular chaperone DnaK
MNDLGLFFYPTEKKSKKTEFRCYGIDLGTTNSTLAETIWRQGEKPACRILEIDQATQQGQYTSPLIPSVVAILPDDQVWVGEGAKRLRTRPQEAGLLLEKNLFYETKNDIGLRKTYYRAPEPFNHASKIAGHILRFLKDSAERDLGRKLDNLSVSVPASFQLNQRRDTLLACEYAGLTLQDDDLLDEPTAALIDYIMATGTDKVVQPGKTSTCVVFDFGGGTCDVSVLEITGDKKSKSILMSQIAVSRYHRLGGGDIDAAIVHEHLIPDLQKENGLEAFALSWAEKKRGIEPQLLGTAEALKIALCKEIDRLKKFGKYDSTDKAEIKAQQPQIKCRIGKHDLWLLKPTLTAEQFETILEPFLDRDLLYARETEYRLTQSVFAPLQDAMDRADKNPKEIDFCLMVGGSSLIPQVREAIDEYFDRSSVGFFQDADAIQTAVARGAAWNRLFKELTSRNLIRPVLYDAIALVTKTGDPYPLVPAQSPLPYPEDGLYAKVDLVVPHEETLFVDRVCFEVIGLKDHQTIFFQTWELPDYVTAGTEIIMEYRVTPGKQFQCRAFLKDHPETMFENTVENPFLNIVNPGSVRLMIEEKEEELRKKGGGSSKDRDDFVQLAEWYAELNQKEKALEFLRMAMNKLKRPDIEILNLQGIYCGELGDHDREEKFYHEADKYAAKWGGPLFNLALSYFNRRKYQEALETIEKAIKKEGETGPYLTLKAMCLEKLDHSKNTKPSYQKSLDAFDKPSTLSEWEIGWYSTAAKHLGDEKYIKLADNEFKRRGKEQPDKEDLSGVRPDIKGGLVPTGNK